MQPKSSQSNAKTTTPTSNQSTTLVLVERFKEQCLRKNKQQTNVNEFILQYSIDVTYSRKYPLVLLRYKNDAKDSDLTRICCGLIIEKFTNKIIAFPMDKFSNSTLHLKPILWIK